MAQIVTFLGKGGTGRTTLAIASAKQLAQQGRTLLAVQETGPVLELMLGIPISSEPQEISHNLHVVQLHTATLLERSWEEMKKLEAQYLRSPFFKSIYGQELGVLPGMDCALALNALREYDASGNYNFIVYDGLDSQTTLRMLGMPEILSWYTRRFRDAFNRSDLSTLLMPFVQPVLSAVLTVDESGDQVAQSASQASNLLERGQAAIADPSRVAAYLVTTSEITAIARAKYLWGSAQQIGLTVGGVLLNQMAGTDRSTSESLQQHFAPLPISFIPHRQDNDWQPLIASTPNFSHALQAPRPIVVNVAERLVRLFLPGFDKKQVKLIQSGPEITIEAGDQRRNLFLPPELRGCSARSARFQDDYLTISF